MSKFPSQEMDRFNVRLPTGMRDAIAERAKRNGRSMNSEILDMLSNALHVPGVQQDDIEQALAKLTPDEIEKMSNERMAEIKNVLLATAKAVTLELSNQNGYLHQVMDVLILMESKKPT